MMQYSYTYSDAVHFAAESALRTYPFASRSEHLRELLYGLGNTIPEAWSTSTRQLLAGREACIELLLEGIRSDLGGDYESYRYQVLSSILQLALMVKQLGSHVC
jgi:hypothetical protein